MSKVLTITVPSYNVEKFLENTLDSFVDERILADIEVLIVDDGSKDNTAKIGKSYEDKYPDSFRVISKENGGHGSTINRGIKEARGRYFKVVDGDDWVDSDGFYELIQKLKTCEADYVVTNYYEVDDNTKEKTPVSFEWLTKDLLLEFSAIAKETKISMHALVIRTAILKDHNIRLDEHCFYVDVEYILYPIPYVNTVEYFDIYVYMYRLAQATQSVSMAGFQKHIQNHIDVIYHVLDYINEYKKQTDYNKLKGTYMARRIGDMINDQASIFSSYSLREKGIKKKFMDFDVKIKEKSLYAYKRSSELSGMLRLLRKTNFRMYGLIVGLSKIRNRK